MNLPILNSQIHNYTNKSVLHITVTSASSKYLRYLKIQGQNPDQKQRPVNYGMVQQTLNTLHLIGDQLGKWSQLKQPLLEVINPCAAG